METPKIEKGIPIPPKKGKVGKWSFMKNMEIGDSFFIPDAQVTKCFAKGSIQSIANAKGIRVCHRRVDGGYRVWRIK